LFWYDTKIYIGVIGILKPVSRCEICGTDKELLQSHHITSKCYGGSNSVWNLAFICPNCHSSVHEGLVIIEGKFMSTKSKVLIYRNQGEDSITGLPDPKVHIVKRKKLNGE